MNLMAQILINVVIAFLAGSLLLGFHRKVMARVQLRPGPPIIQYLLHSLKFFFKETSFPKTAAMPFYVGITVILAAVWVTAVIVGPVAQGSLMIIFGVYAIHKIVEHNAGSSSGSPYGKLSCVRAVFSAAGELPLFAVIAIIFLLTGTMDISGIIAYQAVHGPLVMQLPLAAIMFFTLIVTKSPYSPFAITKGKEIISGFETEHFGLTIFFGPISVVGYLIGMIVICIITGFINATTPMLNPNHSVMAQISIAVICTVGSIIMIII